MGSDQSRVNSLPGSSDGSNEYFFLDPAKQPDPAVHRLQKLIIKKLPALRDHVLRTFRDDSRLNDFVDRLYVRLRGALPSKPDLEESDVLGRFVSIVHEERRRERKRFDDSRAVEIDRVADRSDFDLLIALTRKDELKKFIACLDDWTRQAFQLRYSSLRPKSTKELAKAFGIKENAFDRRWSRGMERGRAEYAKRYGPWMP
jgi:DNA-directed RNA polymerase specialized sigma24 family protein